MPTTADLRNGVCIRFNNELYTVIYFQHVKPGKGGAFVRTKLKSICNKKVIDHTFNAGTDITIVRTCRKPCQFLYKDASHYYFMEEATFETFPISQDMIQNGFYLKEGTKIEVVFRDDTNEPLVCVMPAAVWLKVTSTESGVKGNTATRALKPARLETGSTIQVPLFVENGDVVKVDTSNNTYLAREKGK